MFFYIIKERNMVKSNDSNLYKGIEKELKEYNEWIDRAFQLLMQKYKYACQDNDNLRSKITAYQGGMKDAELVQAQIPKNTFHNEGNATRTYNTPFGRKTVQVKGYRWVKPPVSDDSSDLPKIPLNDIIDLCNTDEQKEVAAFYYDQKLDSYNSYQKTGIALDKSRQCIYHHVKAIKKEIAAKFNK
jgi:hypothetical protein